MITPSMLGLLGLLAKCQGAYSWLLVTQEAESAATKARSEALDAWLDALEFAWAVADYATPPVGGKMIMHIRNQR